MTFFFLNLPCSRCFQALLAVAEGLEQQHRGVMQKRKSCKSDTAASRRRLLGRQSNHPYASVGETVFNLINM